MDLEGYKIRDLSAFKEKDGRLRLLGGWGPPLHLTKLIGMLKSPQQTAFFQNN